MTKPVTPPDWLDLCITDGGKNPKPLPILHNALLALRSDQYAAILGFDEMLAEPIVYDPEPRPITDEDLVYIQDWMQESGLKRMAFETAKHATITYCKERPIHPLKNDLEKLTWDGTKRLETWLQVYAGCEDGPYVRAIGKYFLIAMCRRIIQPGCKADYMLVLEGQQGKLKSTMCEILAGETYFSDHLPEIHNNNKDVSQHLEGKWLIEIAELHAFGKAESTQLKSFLSRRSEKYRPPYGRTQITRPRQCLFIGTTNKDAYLRDETGGRRFWPVKCGHILIDQLRESRDQILAEAWIAAKAGVRWWPTHHEEDIWFKPQQEARFEADAWEESVKSFINGKNFVTVADVATNGIGMQLQHVTRSVEMRVSATLRNLGCVPTRLPKEQGQKRGYRIPLPI